MIEIRPARPGDQAEWLRMRALLRPSCPAEQQAGEIGPFLGTDAADWSKPFQAVAAFVAVRPAGGLCGFLEASIRPFAEDCETWPVGYVEGWFVDPDRRCQGIGRRLMAAAEEWALSQGCQEMASDAQMGNGVSLEVHKALGFEETSRAVHFRKWLNRAGGRHPDQRPTSRHLLALPDAFAVCKLDRDMVIPPWATTSHFLSITRTNDELSIVCPQVTVPAGVQCERGWRCLRVAGTLPFTLVGVLASLVAPLAHAGISVFALSTFDTDYLLVKEQDFDRAVAALQAAGHSVSH